jgi:hypothetical protein
VTTLPRRIHITGGPGAGKSRLAGRLSTKLRLPVFDLDGRGLAHEATLPDPQDMAELLTLRLEETAAIAAHTEWLSEGSNFLAAEPFFAERPDHLSGSALARGVLSHPQPPRQSHPGGEQSLPRLAASVAVLALERPLLQQSESTGLKPVGHAQYAS